MDYLEQLNSPQREGVENLEGPTMIIAGAGSGKTRVLTYRIAHLIRSKNVDPFSILALTFTNKAAKEMRARIESVAGTDARNLWMGTFHSIFARILRSEADKLGYPSNFTIYDTDDSKSLIRNIVKEKGLDDKVYKHNLVYNRISGAKNNLISWQNYLNNPLYISEDEQALKPKMGIIYKEYVERCFRSGAMDFDDLLFNTNVLFRDHLDVLNKYQQRFKYVMIDEFQDTNISQYLITKRLASVHQNICVVGDDAQSIYAFRGANIQNILNFEKDYPDLRVIKLEQNYRSTQNIVNAANSVILKNSAQLQKNIWTDNDNGELVNLIKSTSDNEEGRLVASSIFEDRNNKKLENRDFAILYRTNSQSRSMEEALRKMNIPYRIFGGLSFYQRKEIKDLLSYLRFVINPNDEQSFRRIINLPKRGIGASSVDKIIVAGFENDMGIFEVLENIRKFISGRTANAVENFVTLIKTFKIKLERADAYETAAFIAKQSGLLRDLYDDKTIEGLNRYENVQELLNAIKEFVDTPEQEDKSLEAFIADVALLTDANKENPADTDYVNMMTIHSAKGLEFKHVYVVGMEEDLFPSQMMLNSRADLEEERRLFYVALTRAMEKVTLSYALTRYRFGRLKSCEPSRFIEEIAPEFVKVDRKFNNSEPMGKLNSGQGNSFYARNLVAQRKAENKVPPGKKLHTPSPDFAPSDTRKLDTGMRVEHPKFGFGDVKKMDVEGANRKATIEFENFGEKTLLLTFAKLRIME
ncbi:exodeoxyribonuclease V subunit gamma [Marivirga sp. S37H4]|uniref:DNA 3'-5' helicase n=1 Tax=Marivirga aurantiaca TaxID=2802615 RepID=A0A934WWL3_9BACT|nr:UvrD-helicase domain-containing protein [Marivirga aurantiaca]MBK6264170.1 exodeoxyribonuclease V subunit gamma [Marivirga aurantiaca]